MTSNPTLTARIESKGCGRGGSATRYTNVGPPSARAAELKPAYAFNLTNSFRGDTTGSGFVACNCANNFGAIRTDACADYCSGSRDAILVEGRVLDEPDGAAGHADAEPKRHGHKAGQLAEPR